MASSADDWSLDQPTREATVSRLSANLVSMAFARGAALDIAEALEKARSAERRAYTTAQVESRTTTGVRPHAETLRAYARKLAEIALDIVKDAAASPKEESAASASAAAAGGNQEEEGENEFHDHDLRGDREFLTAASAEEALGPMLAPGAAHARVRFSTKSFGAEAAAVAARALANVSATLRHADLSDIIAGRNEGDALEALRTIAEALAEAPLLESLDVSDNALGEKGVRALAAALRRGAAAAAAGAGGGAAGGGPRAPLRSVAMRNVGASVHACAALAETLEHAGELRSLSFHNNMSGDEGATFLASIVGRAPKLESLRVASSRVGEAGGRALAAALCAAAGLAGAAGGALRSLDLSDNPLTSAAGPSLALAVARHGGLRRLVLADNGLLDSGVAQVCAALARGAAPGLEELDLSLNEVTPVGARSIATALKSLKKLKILSVRENELENAGARALAAGVAACPSLTRLDATQNQLRRPGAVALARAASRAPGLELLALDDNEVSDEGVEEVEEILRGAGKAGALGPMDDNDGDGDDDDDEEEEEEEEGGEEEGAGEEGGDGIDLDLSKALDAALKI